MNLRVARVFLIAITSLAVGGCQSAVRKLKIPLSDAVPVSPTAAERVVIEDHRPMTERRAHRGKQIMSCEHWLGDDTFVPSRIVYLQSRVAARTRSDMRVRIRLTHFDVVEYCEFVRGGDGTGAATLGGTVGLSGNAASGNTVIIRLAGAVDGVPFDQSSRFDYGAMYRFPDAPSSSAEYRAQLRARLDALIDGIANKVWDAELVRKGLAR